MGTQKSSNPRKPAKESKARYLGTIYGNYIGAKMGGTRFGRLVVQYIAGRRDDKLYWVCLCDCGRKVIAYQADLRKGRVKSCDKPECIEKSKIKKKWVDYSILAGKTE